MKKLLLLETFLLLTILVFGQKAPRLITFQDLITTTDKAPKVTAGEKTVGVTLWEDNFNTPSTWVLNNSGQTAANFGWNINNTSQGWWSTAGITATGGSGGNNAELSNGDASIGDQALDVTYTMTTAQPIDIVSLGGSNQVSLTFRQYGARFNDLQEITRVGRRFN